MTKQVRWAYLQNPFNNVTKQSFKRMLIMATDHFDKLGASARNQVEIQEIYDWAKPEFDAFVQQMDKNEQLAENYRYATATFRELIDVLRTQNVRRWDILIQIEYEQDSKEYQRIMPNGRSVFQLGAYEIRLRSVRKLAESLKQFPNLSDLQADVEAFSAQLHEARSKQQEWEGLVQISSDALEKARIALAQKMHGSFAALLRIHWNEPAAVENFYELKYLRSKPLKEDDDVQIPSEEFMIAPNSYAKFGEGIIATRDELRISNNGRKAIIAYLSDAVQAELPTHAISIYPDQYVTLNVTANDMLLVLVNEMDVEGKVVVERLMG